ncbi:tyrosyl-DNA phosphodiesterase 2 isoform X2 [Triplophysa rosa]|uniref:tyrosyl-DNA phosphodiesterase 2 isoform X2 n=1 Tax=Triplophysa rosa TaxID=992332 RepID=UPI0025460F58|nr:tyrosyl-DNA phosphodiesterase 2 isoform X2 [Triplophysa rosa]
MINQTKVYQGEPPAGTKGNSSSPVDVKVNGKTGKKKKNKHRQRTACQKITDSVCSSVTVEDQSSTLQQRSKQTKKRCARSKQEKSAQQTSDRSTRDQSTQTESPQSVQTQTETPSDQGIDSPATESKSTQTRQTSFTLHQAYWGKSPTDDGAVDEQAPQSNSTSNQLTVISWNIDGLDLENVYSRSKGLLSHLGKYRADVVLLQELIPPYLNLLQSIMKDYEFVLGNQEGYFTGILLRKGRVQFLESNIVKYPTTEMDRNLLIANVSFLGRPLCIMTSHLESCKANSQERLNQLRRVWKWTKEAPLDHTVIFGGDTNLRDWEVKKLGGLPNGIFDVWEMLGEPEESRYTWDTSINDNKEIPNSIRLRFDRLFLRPAAEGAQVQPETMALIGLEKLKCDYFISDHWGILCTFLYGSA